VRLLTSLTLGFVVFLGLAATAPLAARAGNVMIKNETGHCAWVTVYTAYGMTRWEIVSGQYGRPRHVMPGVSQQFMFPQEPELKVRAEVARNADCSGGNIADVYDVRKGINVNGWFDASIVKHGDRFWITIK
jgi:hypothetical protein